MRVIKKFITNHARHARLFTCMQNIGARDTIFVTLGIAGIINHRNRMVR